MEKRYIYKTKHFQWNESDNVLNALGSEGWELVSIISKSLNYAEKGSGIPNPLDFLSPESRPNQEEDLKPYKGIL